MTITQVSDTAHWVALYRAIETERPDALFKDPHARRMAGACGDAIARDVAYGHQTAQAMVVRTAVMDELIMTCVERGAGAVLNLGAGLDTRAFRLPLPRKMNWLDIDLPGVVAHRRKCLQGARPACRHQHMAANLNDPAEFDMVLAAARKWKGPVLVVSEGLLIYLSPQQVGRLAIRLRCEVDALWWLADLVSPALLGWVGNGWPSREAAACAPFQFAPDDSAKFFEPLGWKETEFRSLWDESVKRGRAPPLAQWWSSFGAPWWPTAREAWRRMSGVALMQPTASGAGPRTD